MNDESVTHWMEALRNGDSQAAQPIWERYQARLLALARQRLQQLPRTSGDEEDVVQNVFKSFFSGIIDGRFPQLDDREDLWRLLVVITARKSIDQVRREGKREAQAAADPQQALEAVVGGEPTPELAAQLIEQYERLVQRLGSPTLQQVAAWKLEGYNNREIAEKLGRNRRTVIRKLQTIRAIWESEFEGISEEPPEAD